MADHIKRTPGIWGGELVQPQPSMGGREVAEPSNGPTEFMHEVARPPGQVEEEAVFLGEIYTNTEQEISRTGSMFGKAWGVVAERLP